MKRRLNLLLSAFDRKDIPIIAFALGLALIGFGASQIYRGAGPVVVGMLLVLYVRPLQKWVR